MWQAVAHKKKLLSGGAFVDSHVCCLWCHFLVTLDWVLGAGGPNAPARVSQPARVLYDPDSQPVLAPTSVAVGAQGLVMHHSYAMQ